MVDNIRAPIPSRKSPLILYQHLLLPQEKDHHQEPSPLLAMYGFAPGTATNENLDIRTFSSKVAEYVEADVTFMASKKKRASNRGGGEYTHNPQKEKQQHNYNRKHSTIIQSSIVCKPVHIGRHGSIAGNGMTGPYRRHNTNNINDDRWVDKDRWLDALNSQDPQMLVDCYWQQYQFALRVRDHVNALQNHITKLDNAIAQLKSVNAIAQALQGRAQLGELSVALGQAVQGTAQLRSASHVLDQLQSENNNNPQNKVVGSSRNAVIETIKSYTPFNQTTILQTRPDEFESLVDDSFTTLFK